MDDARIRKVVGWLQSQPFDALCIDDPIDLLYLTGLSLSLGRLLLTRGGVSLFVDGRYIAYAKKNAPCAVADLEDDRKFAQRIKKMAFDSAFVSYEGYEGLKKKFPELELTPLPHPLKHFRVIKEPQEIALLKKAARLTREGFEHIASLLKEGISEEELAVEFECFCRKKGASHLSFLPIIAFGENSAYPHHRAGKTTLKKDSIVLFDLGAVVDGYAGDMTRIVFFGKADPQLKKDYDLVYATQKKVIAKVKPGIRFGELDQIAREEIAKHGCKELFTHGLSHGIGLDVHEYPRLKITGGDVDLILEPGMAFSVEPGVYRPGLGGIRYEDIVLVTKTGHEEL